MGIQQFLVEFQDFLAPRLDTYEQAIYLYIFASSAESMGEFWFGEVSKLVI